MNKKGMTLVEIIVAISLISVVMIFLFQVLFTVVNGNKRNNTKSKTLISKAIIMKAVEHDLDTFGLKDNDANSSVLDCHDSIYEEFESGTLNQILPVTARDNDYYCIKFIFNPINVKNNEGYLLFYQNNDKGFLAYKRGVKSGNGFIPESQIVREIDAIPKTDSSSDLIKIAEENDLYSLKIDIPIIAIDGNNYDLALNYIYSDVINNPNPDVPPSEDNNATITLVLNGGTYNDQTGEVTIPTQIGNEEQLSIPAKEGYTFKEWTIVRGEADINENKITPRTNLVKLSATYEESIICGEFVSDPWKTIAECVRNRSGDSAPYDVGEEKKVAINGTNYTVRIANNSNYDCTLDSKTACGFVVEFVDIITGYNMNPAGTYNRTYYEYGTNLGGWPSSAMYKYLNGDTTDHLTYDGSNATLYSKLPSDLRSAIIDTYTVSGHGKSDTGTRSDGNWESKDQLYLLTTGEIYSDCLTSNCWDKSSYPYNSSGGTTTRQLDYYQNIGVSKSSYSGAIKQKNGSNAWWWLRAASPNSANTFRYVNSDGDYTYSYVAYNSGGVAPAFRIG